MALYFVLLTMLGWVQIWLLVRFLRRFEQNLWLFDNRYGHRITYHLGVEKAKIKFLGVYSMSFNHLRWYVEATRVTNRRSLWSFSLMRVVNDFWDFLQPLMLVLKDLIIVVLFFHLAGYFWKEDIKVVFLQQQKRMGIMVMTICI